VFYFRRLPGRLTPHISPAWQRKLVQLHEREDLSLVSDDAIASFTRFLTLPYLDTRLLIAGTYFVGVAFLLDAFVVGVAVGTDADAGEGVLLLRRPDVITGLSDEVLKNILSNTDITCQHPHGTNSIMTES